MKWQEEIYFINKAKETLLGMGGESFLARGGSATLLHPLYIPLISYTVQRIIIKFVLKISQRWHI